MRRSALLGITFTLFLATALAMIAAAVLLQPAPIPAATSALGRSDVVDRFYRAANEVIATGDPAPLDAVVAPHFSEHDPLPGFAPGRDGLADYLVTLHRLDPGLQLTAEAIVATGDLAVASVEVHSDRPPTSLGGSVVDLPAPWSRVDVFRVAGGVIVERWSEPQGTVLVSRLAEASFVFPEAPLVFPVPSPRVLTLERIMLPPGARWSARAGGADMLYVESGQVVVTVATVTPALPEAQNANTRVRDAIIEHPAVSLAVGQSLAVAPGSRFTAANTGTGSARLLAVTFAVPAASAGAPPPEVLPDGVLKTILAGGLATDLPTGAARLTIGEIRLGREAQLSLSADRGPILVAVESGRLDLVSSASAWIRQGDDGHSSPLIAAELATGDGATLRPGSFTQFRVAGDDSATLLVVSLASAS